MPLVAGLQANVFRAVSGSLFSSPVNWSRGVVPTGSDVAMIADNCTIDISRTIGSLVVRAPFTASINTGLTLLIKDIIDVKGHLSCSGAPNIVSEARKNNINSLLAASSSFTYSGSNQNIPGVSYYNLIISNNGTKTIINDTTIINNLTIQPTNYTTPASILELSRYNLIVSGTTSVNGLNSNIQTSAINKSGFGNVLFTNALVFGFRAASAFDFSIGNPNVELRNGISFSQNLVGFLGYNFKSGIGIWSFTTNNQTIDGVGSGQTTITFDAPMIIGSGVSLKIGTNTTNYNNLQIGKYINGVSSSSALVNVGNIVFTSKEAIETSMSTGSVDFTSSINTITIGGNYSATIPSKFNTFRDLYIVGTGTKTLGANSIISGSLIMGTTGSLELGNNNLTLLGNMAGPNDFSNRALFSKSGPGNILFAANIVPNCVNFNLSGNPTVEFRNGANLVNVNFFNFGTGSVTFSTNNQTFQGNSAFNFSGSLIISGGITLTLAKFAGGGSIGIYNTINGTTGSSVLVNNTEMYFYNSVSYTPMATSGTFSYLNSLSTLGYMFDKDVPLPYTQYNNVYVAGTKSLAGDTYISGAMGFDPSGILPGRLELSSSSLFVSGGFGTNTLNTFISKNSNVGTLIFNGNAYTNGTTWQLTGNPAVEFRNGLRVLNPTLVSQSFGSGSMVFSQNNQIISCNGGLTFANPITVSGSITLTLDGFSGAGSHTFSGSINGTEANSKLAIAANGGTPTITYYNSQAPMLTGSIDFSSSLNTFVYGSGSQDIRGGTYRNLTLNGGGVKTLQGNVSVQNTYTLTPPATLNLNGFTLTNP